MNPIATADDYFSGAGGWDVAAEALGIHARGIENMAEARATRDAAGLTTIHDDVWTFVPDGKAEGQIASPPCPTFSAAGKGDGRKAMPEILRAIEEGTYKNVDILRSWGEWLGRSGMKPADGIKTALVLTPLHFAAQYDYRWLAWEQVPTVLPVWEACAEVLRAQGWNVWTGNVQAEQYGVPQTRKRAKLLASRDHDVDRLTPTHSKYHNRTPAKLDEGVLPWVSMAQALGIGASDRVVSNYGTGGDPRNRGERTGEQPAATVTPKIDRNVVVREVARSNKGGDWQPTEREVGYPAFTVTGSGRNVGWRWAMGDVRSSRVTVEEAGILQSFPANYPWQGSKSKQCLQVGNAVPPLLALHSLSMASGIAIPALISIEEQAS